MHRPSGKYGGADADVVCSCIQAEEFAKVNLGFSVAIGVDTGASTIFDLPAWYGRAAAKIRYPSSEG